MGLKTEYPIWFEAIWKAYPTHLYPHRHRKFKAYQVAVKRAKDQKWVKEDIQKLINTILDQRKHNKNWLPHSEIGPMGFQTWLRDRVDEDAFDQKQERKKDKYDLANEEQERRQQEYLRLVKK